MTKKTKDFKHPAQAFMTTGENLIKPDSQEPGQGVPMKPNPLYLETKSRRLQLLIKPSLHAKLRARATAQDMSLNELIHSILEQYADAKE
jgi:hypothetical protein